MRRWWLVLVLVLASSSLSSIVASAGGTPAISVDPSTVEAGQRTTVTGSAFPAGTTTVIRLDAASGQVLADDVELDRDGDFDVEVMIPASTSPGAHTLWGCWTVDGPETCPARAGLTVTAPSTTTAAPTTSGPPPPPTTGVVVPPPTATTGPTVVPPPTGTVTTTTQPGAPIASPTTEPPTTGVIATTTTTQLGELAGQTTTTGLALPDLQGSPEIDLEITGMEVTQGIQNLDNDMPLVAGRTTMVRVYVETDGGSMADVSGVLQVVRQGSVEVEVVEPDNAPITATPSGSDRLDTNGTLNFTLSTTSTAPTGQGDNAILTAFVFNASPTAPAQFEPTDVNNFEAELFEFHPVQPLTVRLFPVHMHEPPTSGSQNVTVGTSVADFFWTAASINGSYRYMPVSEIVTLPGGTIFPTDHATGGEFSLTASGAESAVLNQIQAEWDSNTPVGLMEQYYGLVRAGIPATWGGFSNGTVAYGKVNLVFGAGNPWYHNGGWLVAHELGHSIAFPHINCDGSEGSPGPFPYDDPCSLAEVDPNGYYGFDILHTAYTNVTQPTVISNDPGDSAPNAGFPLMGYMSPKWADPWHYCRLLDLFGVNCTALSIPENQIDPPEGLPEAPGPPPYEPAPDADGWLYIAAGIDPAAGTAEFRITEHVAEPLPHVFDEYRDRRARGEPTDIVAELVGADGTTLAALPMVSLDAAGENRPDEPPTVISVVDYLPFLDGAASVRLRLGDAVAAEQAISASAPVVEVTGPAGGGLLTAPLEITWSASDADGDPLTFNIAYSPDAGETWTSVARAVSGDAYPIGTFDGIPGGDAAVFRVTASDGVLTGSALSEPSRVPDGPPSLTLLSPADGSTFGLGTAIVLSASVWDLEDGSGGDREVGWSSDVDGELGSGTSLILRDFTAGPHVVEASATDSSGNEATATVTVEITHTGAVTRMSSDDLEVALVAVRAGPTAIDEASEDDAPADASAADLADTDDSSVLSVVVIIAVLVMTAGAIGVVVWRRRTRLA